MMDTLERTEDGARRDCGVSRPGRACCCTARPAVRVLLPPTGTSPHTVDLYLCGHHYRASRKALNHARALVMVGARSAVSR